MFNLCKCEESVRLMLVWGWRMAGVLLKGSAKSEISYELVHDQSGARLLTMAPLDNGGDGSSFSPTDLCAVSLGACASTIMGIYARKKGFSLSVSFELLKEMETAPRRIASIRVVYNIATGCEDSEFEVLKNLARNCPVRKSLHPDILIHEEFIRRNEPCS